MRTLRKLLLVTVLVCVFIASLVFSSRNTELVSVDLLVFTLQLPASVWLLLSTLLGCFLGMLASLGWLLRAERLRHKYRNASHNQR